MATRRITKRARPHRVPPPLLHGEERIDGEPILTELSGDLALLAWKTYRTAALWIACPDAERAGLYDRASKASREGLIEILEARTDLPLNAFRGACAVTMQARGAGSARELATHFRSLEEWAEGIGAIECTMMFAQLAARAVPESGMLAINVARRARAAGHYARAESWFRQAIAVSRAEADWDSYVSAYLGLGVTYRLRGSYPLARKALGRGFRRARRQARRDLQGMALHELMIVAGKAGRVGELERYGRGALEQYGDAHPRLPALAHDVAVFLMNRGHFELALRAFRAIPPDFGDSADRLARLASMVRASGSLGDEATFDMAWKAAEELLQDPAATMRGTGLVGEMARGALSMGYLDRAREAATRARRFAELRLEAEYRMEAEAILQEIEAHSGARVVTAVPAPSRVAAFTDSVIAGLAPPTAVAGGAVAGVA